MTLRNLGPVREAAIRIAPLTVFIGPGNTGKSYAATAVHSLIRAVGREKRLLSAGTAAGFDARPGPASIRTLAACKKSIDAGLGAVLDAFNADKSASVPARMSDAIARHCLTSILADGLTSEITRNMPSGPQGLVRFGCKSMQIDVANGSHASVLKWGKTTDVSIRAISPIVQTLVEDEGAGVDPLLARMPRDPEDPIEYTMSNWMANNQLRRHLPQVCYVPITRKIFSGMAEASYYLPASRSGILNAYRTVLDGAIRSLSGAAGDHTGTGSMPGTTVDFLADLVKMTEEKGALFALGEEMEQSILRGRIGMRKASKIAAPEIVFKYRGSSVPIQSASSSVSELAPLILYLKHAVQPSDLLVIEEPEAHLHPASQALLAKFIVRMVRAGLYVLATTHSEILLEEFSKCLEAGQLSDDSKRTIFGDPLAYLLPGEVAPYSFSMDDRGWSTAREIQHSGDDGIDEGEFIRVHEELHDEAARMEDIKSSIIGDAWDDSKA